MIRVCWPWILCRTASSYVARVNTANIRQIRRDATSLVIQLPRACRIIVAARQPLLHKCKANRHSPCGRPI
ncbi:hypothetical protein F5Y04DRAFT_252388 [Hypomontagnella monticulosa]|nr:hypothetical protein F5Y04DRAFT_252388 [Hypomontagnella monticulosa]